MISLQWWRHQAGQEALTDFDIADAADLLVVYLAATTKAGPTGGRRRRIAVISTALGSWSRWPQEARARLRHRSQARLRTGMSNGGFANLTGWRVTVPTRRSRAVASTLNGCDL